MLNQHNRAFLKTRSAVFFIAFLLPAAAAAAAPSLLEIVAKAGCKDCHNADGVASDTRLVFPEAGSPVALVRQLGAGMLELVNPKQPERSRLLLKPTKRIAHEGGRRIVPDSPEDEGLLAFVREVARAAAPIEATTRFLASVASGPEAVAERPGFRRLSASQYDNTVRDLLGDVSRPSRAFPPEDFVDGFKNQYQAQGTSPVLTEAYNLAAGRLSAAAARSIRRGDGRHFLACAPAQGSPACRDRFIHDFGRRAFRRPLGDDEASRFGRLFEGAGQDFVEGARVVIEAMLQSPSFLYVVDEKDPTLPWLESYARATRLAYFLWNSMPDDALLSGAERGELATPEGIERAAERLIADPRAGQAMDEFVAQWLRLDRVRDAAAEKDRKDFPLFTADLTAAMVEETRRLVGDLIWNDRNFLEVFTARHTFVNGALANLYGIPSSGGPAFVRVPYPADVDRVGVLGHGSFLAGTSKPADTSPTARGLFVREHLLCQKVPSPPPGVNQNLPRPKTDRPQTNRELLAMHVADETCARCHNLMDGIGFGFEHFDATGAYRSSLKKKTFDLPLDTRGTIAGLGDSSFAAVRDIGSILSQSRQCQRCIVKQLYRYATGRRDTPADAQAIDAIFEEFRRSGFRFRRLMIAVARWAEFRLPPRDS